MQATQKPGKLNLVKTAVSATQNDSEPFDTSLLFFVLGLVVGLVTLTLVCVCCPATHKKATSLMNAAKRRRNETKGDKSVPRMTLGAARGQEAIPSLATADMTGNQENVYNEPDFYNELNSACDSRKYNTSRSLPSVPGVKGSGHNHLNTVAANVSGNSSKQVNSKFNNPDIHVSIPSHSICQCHAYQPFIPSRNYTENYSVFQLDGCSDPNVKSKFDTPVPDTMPAEEPHDYFVLEATSDRVSEKIPVPGHDKSDTENAGLGPDKSNTETAGSGPDKSNTETAGSGPDKSNTETAGNGPDKSNTGTAGSKITGSESK